MPTPDPLADVALVAPYPPAGVRHAGHSGVASYTSNLSRSLAAAGAKVTVIAPELAGEPAVSSDGGVRVERAFRSGAWALPTALRAAAATGAPVVHLQHELFLYGGPAALPGLVTGLRGLRRAGSGPASSVGRPAVVVTAHQVVDPRRVDDAYRRMHRIAAPAVLARAGLAGVQTSLRTLSDAVVVHEPAFRELLPGARVVAHGVEDVQVPDRAAAREALGLGDRLTCLCFGFLAPYKGLELAGAAAQRVGADTVELVLAGGQHPRLAARGDRYAADLERRFGDVARLTGYVPEEEVPLWFAAADVALFLYPQPHASSGALALALAYGTPSLLSPALAATVGAPPQMQAPAHAEGLADRLRRLAASPHERAELGATTRALADGRTWPAVAAQHLSLYEEVSHAVRTPGRGLRAVEPR